MFDCCGAVYEYRDDIKLPNLHTRRDLGLIEKFRLFFSAKHLQSEIDEYSEDENSPVRHRRSADDDSEIVNDDHFKCKQHSRKVRTSG